MATSFFPDSTYLPNFLENITRCGNRKCGNELYSPMPTVPVRPKMEARYTKNF